MVTERFARNLEAYLLCARRHNIVVNFTFFAFVPHTGMRGFDQAAAARPESLHGSRLPSRRAGLHAFHCQPLPECPLAVLGPHQRAQLLQSQASVEGQHAERRSHGDRGVAQVAAGQVRHDRGHAGRRMVVSRPRNWAASISVPLPTIAGSLRAALRRCPNQMRAIDYNHFAQDISRVGRTRWSPRSVRTGSSQLVNVGQDEGGVTDRVLNQFYATSGVSFTTNHTYWRDDGLLWDSVAAKRRGHSQHRGRNRLSARVGSRWHVALDEFTGAPLLERKWALGFAAANQRHPDLGLGSRSWISASCAATAPRKSGKDMLQRRGAIRRKGRCLRQRLSSRRRWPSSSRNRCSSPFSMPWRWTRKTLPCARCINTHAAKPTPSANIRPSVSAIPS